MRQTAAGLNRGWLTVIGLVVLLLGVAVVLIGTGWLAAFGLPLALPDPGSQIAPGLIGLADTVLGAVVIGLVGLVLLLAALAWLGAQIPRSNSARPYRLHDDTSRGLTTIAPEAVTDAVAAQVESLPGVRKAAAVLRGSASAPDLTIKVTANDRATLPALLQAIQTTVVDDLGRALDTQVAALAVQIEVDSARTSTSRAVL